MKLIRKLTLLAATISLAGLTAQTAFAQTEIRFARFFGSCEADFADITDPSTATNECGVITALTNKFNAENPDIRVVTEMGLSQIFLVNSLLTTTGEIPLLV